MFLKRNLAKLTTQNFLSKSTLSCSQRLQPFSSRSVWKKPYEESEIERDELEYDVLVVGGGPAGLSTAIRIKQLCQEKDQDLNVCLVEKGSHIGAHILSGNVFQPTALNELFPDWKEMGAPLETPVTADTMKILTESSSYTIPEAIVHKTINNDGNYIISLSQLCEWLGEQAEEVGVEILPGIAGDNLLYNDDGSVGGIITNDQGIAKDGSMKDEFEPGIKIKARQTVLTEGCRGSLTEKAKKQFDLQKHAKSVQNYGIGLKEIWTVADDNPHFKSGMVQHTVNWPLGSDVYGGSFLYHMNPNLIHIGMVVGLDYKNPYLNPYEEFQRFKTHPEIKKLLDGGECISYGARCLNEGGYYAIPKLTFPGGMLAGCSAGFLNVAKIKGSHNAMKSGMVAGEQIFEKFMHEEDPEYLDKKEITEYEDAIKKSWVWDDMYETRNIKGGFKKYGLWGGVAHAGIVQLLTKGREKWEFTNKTQDSQTTGLKKDYKPINYPKKDGKLTFDILTSVSRTGTNHDHDQPAHLKIKEGLDNIPEDLSLKDYAGPEQRFCPAKVYEYIEDENGVEKLQINAQNCIHCKCCSIKMPKEYIDWNVPQGGEGPSYSGM